MLVVVATVHVHIIGLNCFKTLANSSTNSLSQCLTTQVWLRYYVGCHNTAFSHAILLDLVRLPFGFTQVINVLYWFSGESLLTNAFG